MSNPGTLNMIGYWNLDEASGDREDSHLIDFPMHDYSAVGSDTGKINLAAKFIRSSEDRLGYPYAPLLFPTTAFSWVTWINVSSFPGFMDVIATRQSTKNYVLMIDGDAKLRASVYSDDTNKTVYADSYGTLSIDEWVMVYFEAIRSHVDKLELLVDDELWPLPKYRELLFIK